MAIEKGLDLIEIAPEANPPVARIVSYDKFRYQQKKEEKKLESHNKGGELKQIRLSARSAENDLKIKAKKVDEFLEKGHKVEIMMTLRGREKYNQDWAKSKLKEFMKIINPDHKVISPEKFVGKGIVLQVTKK